jgi:hypothetical protein
MPCQSTGRNHCSGVCPKIPQKIGLEGLEVERSPHMGRKTYGHFARGSKDRPHPRILSPGCGQIALLNFCVDRFGALATDDLCRNIMRRKRSIVRLTNAPSGMNVFGKKSFKMGGFKEDVSGRVLSG